MTEYENEHNRSLINVEPKSALIKRRFKNSGEVGTETANSDYGSYTKLVNNKKHDIEIWVKHMKSLQATC